MAAVVACLAFCDFGRCRLSGEADNLLWVG